MSLIDSARTLSPAAWRLVAMRFLIYLGIQASYFIGVMGTIAFQMDGGALELALTVGLLNLAMVLGNFAGGSLLDAVGPRRHFAVCVAALVASGMLFQLVGGTTAGMIVAGALFGMAVGVCDTVARAYPAYLTASPTELKHINSLIATASNVGVVAGPLVGGAIASFAPSRAVFYFTVATALLALVPWLGFRAARDPHAEAEDGAPAATLREGVRVTFTMPTLNLLFWVGFLSFLGFGAFDPLESLFYRDVLNVGIEWMGWLSSAVGLGCILGSLLVLRLPARHVNIRTLMGVLFLMGVGCLVYVGTPYVGVALVGQILLGIAFGMLNPLENTLVQTHVPLESLGRVNAVMGAGYTSAGVVPLLLAPGLAEAFGVQGVLVGASCIVAAFPIACSIALRKRIARLVEEERSHNLSVSE